MRAVNPCGESVSGTSRAVFLSYASEDAQAAARICEALKAAGIEVWFDQGELRGGDTWDQKIRLEIRDCALFVPIISANTQARIEGYFRLEWRLADHRTHLMGKSRAFLVPVCVDDTRETDADIPDSFAAVQWTRLPGGDPSPVFLERIRQILTPAENHAAAPARPASAAPSSPSVVIGATAPSVVPENSIAVLPFTNLGGDPDNEYFSDGLAEEILNALSQVENLRVAARSSAFSFKGKTTDVAEIARKLHVANVLEGSVRRAGTRIRVIVQLVDAIKGFQVWSERYDRQMQDIFELQDDIARAITERLKVTLSAAAKRSTSNVEAYELYLKGRHHWNQLTMASMRAAIQCFEQSIKLDSNYPLPYAGLADAYGNLSFWGWLPTDAARPPAHAAMMRAFALAPTLWEVNFSRAFYILYLERAWQDAEPFLKKCLESNSRSSLGHIFYGILLLAQGRTDGAIEHVSLACEIDPLAPFILANAALIFNAVDRLGEAKNLADRALAVDAGHTLAINARCKVFSSLGQHSEAIAMGERLVSLARTPIYVGVLGGIYGRAGRIDDATRLLRELEDRARHGECVPAYAFLVYWLGQRNVRGVREALSKMQTDGAAPIFIRVSGSALESLRTDPEIDRLHVELLGW
jgi:TolB-like protein